MRDMSISPAPLSVPGPTTLVIGGARSGKTRHALGLAEASGLSPVYVATAQAFDDEMRERIALHQAERGPEWTTLEAPRDLAATLRTAAGPGRVVLVDCLTLWLTNVMLAEEPVAEACEALADAVATAGGPVILVSNEVGLGIVPDNRLARQFRDNQGRLNQTMARVADRVVFIAAGLALTLK